MARIRYNPNDAEDVRKAFEVLTLRNAGNIEHVKAILINDLADQEAEMWAADLNTEVEIIPEWALGLACVRGNKVRQNGVVYRVIQSHVVSDENASPSTTPALFRRAPVIEVGKLFPTWDSIGLLDSENFWLDDDIVWWNGQYWKSNTPTNIWEPGAVGITQWDVFDPEEEEPGPGEDICEGIAPWDSGQHWSTYTIGDKRTSNGGLYEVKDPAWAQSFAPHTAEGLQFGWNFLGNCG